MAEDSEKTDRKSNGGKGKSEENTGIGVIDIFRIIAGLLLLNCIASYFVTGDSVTWNYRPWWIRPKILAARLVRRYRPQIQTGTNTKTERPRNPHRQRTPPVRRWQRVPPHLPRAQRHDLRRDSRPEDLRTWRAVQCIRGTRCNESVCHGLFQRGFDSGLSRRGMDVCADGCASLCG